MALISSGEGPGRTPEQIKEDIASNGLRCSAEGDLRTFVQMGMQFEPVREPGSVPTLEEFAASSDQKLSSAARELIHKEYDWYDLMRKYIHHAARCEVCAAHVAKQKTLLPERFKVFEA